MIYTAIRRLCLFVALAASLAGSPAAARDPARLCYDAARSAASRTGVPLRVLLALTLTETGRAGADGVLAPWPWTLNKGGEGLWFDSRGAARAHLEAALSDGLTNVDVGCFQLNHRWHGQAFRSLDSMLDPETNALYAARFVLRLYRDSGDWTDAAAAYHSGTPEKARRYLDRYGPIYAALERVPDEAPGTVLDADPEPARPRENRFPLLLAGAPQSPGSLVPMAHSRAPLFGAP